MVCCWCMLVHWPIHEIIKIEICLCCSLFETACIKQPHFINVCNCFFNEVLSKPSTWLQPPTVQCRPWQGHRVTRELGSSQGCWGGDKAQNCTHTRCPIFGMACTWHTQAHAPPSMLVHNTLCNLNHHSHGHGHGHA